MNRVQEFGSHGSHQDSQFHLSMQVFMSLLSQVPTHDGSRVPVLQGQVPSSHPFQFWKEGRLQVDRVVLVCVL